MQMTHRSWLWGGRAALLAMVLAGLWGAMSAQAAEKVTLGPWYRIGPLRDQPPLLNWMDNVASSFNHEFGPAKDVGRDHAPQLAKTYPTTNFPATPKAIRRWQKHAEWIDGYYQELPRGPAPSAGETQYLYRTITVSKPTKIMLDFIIRAPESDRRMNQKGMEHWRRTGRYRCLLDGKEILRWEGKHDMPRPVEVSLTAGTHHFLAKATNNRHAYGFAFSIKGMHPELRHEVGFERCWRELIVDLPTERPYYVEGEKVAPKVSAEQRYSEGLARLRAVKFHPEPMPGVEAAARNSKGQIVPAMEAALERYPTSPAGDHHTARLEKLEKTVKPLLAKIDQTGKLHQKEVLAAVAMLEEMWAETIGELPTLIYLERPTYLYDSMMYENVGTKEAVIKTFDPRSRKVETILDFETATPETRAHEINMSWDGKRVWIGGGGQVSAVNRDGTNLRAIQKGQSPCEMPDGRIIFFDNATGQAPCKGNGARRLLYTSDADGENRKLVSGNTCIDTAPSVMNDGRILFTRWDYGVNKNVFNRHALWTQNPDGTGIDLYFGNTVIDPRSLCRARQVPGRPEVLAIFGPHHARLAGLMGLVWNGNGKEASDGLGFRRITHDTASVGDRPPTWAYQDAYPLNEQLFLVTFGGRAKNKAGLYLYDRAGNRKCVLEAASARGIHSAQRLTPEEKPMPIPARSRVPNWKPGVDLHKRLMDDPNWQQKATLTVQDVYQGLEPEIKRGQIKYIAVMEQPAQSHGRGGAVGVGTIWYVNRFLGLVPVEDDGSAFFEVPAMRSLYFHVLDKNGKMLMTQGSDFHTMPGEIRSCIGCHEQRKGISAPPDTGRMRLAIKKAPVQPKLPNWGTRGIIEYETVVQPVFNKYCIECHRGEKPKGRLNLTGDKTTAYNMSYMQLTDGQYVHFTPGTGSTHAQPSNDCDEQAPLSRGSVLSKLTKYIENPEHCKKKIPFDDQLRVFLWIDSNVPYFSHYRQVPDTRLSGKAIHTLKDVHRRRCATCHDPRKSMPDEKSGLNQHHIARHVGGLAGQWGVADSGMRVRHLNLSNPSHSAALQAPLAKSAGGWGMCTKDGKPVFADKNDLDYKLILQSLRQTETRKGIQYKGIKQLLEERSPEPPTKDGEKSTADAT